jgi:tRNA dimethylallyltransferase
MKKVIALCGPTATGKSELAVELALRFNGEVINFDSQQFYQGLDIGTAKPTDEEKKGVPHHLYSILSPDEEMNAGKFLKLVDPVVEDVWKRGKVPILVGGTGLYLRAFEYGLFEVIVPKEIREKVRAMVRENLALAYEELKRLDPEYAKKVSPKDFVRISRALEVCLTTGKPFSEFHKSHSFALAKPRYSILKIGLILEREELYNKINKRALEMINRGWVDEIKKLLDMGCSPSAKAFKAIGYRHIISYLKGEISLDTAIKLIQRDTRRYAKRQTTWFKKEKNIHWFRPEEREKIFALVESFLKDC